MNEINMDALAEEAISNLADLKEEAAKVKSVGDAVKIVPDVIKAVESIAKSAKLAGSQKKDLAVAILNKLIDLPWVPEPVEAKIISLAIDALVAAFNKLFGKSWLAKIV